MEITSGTLPLLKENEGEFIDVFAEYSREVLLAARLLPQLSIQRVVEAHGAWANDIDRVTGHEPQLRDGLDHFKRAGLLAFWVRRMSPLVDVIDPTKDISDAEGQPLTKQEIAFRDLLFPYGNEYLAFDFAYQFCKYYETHRINGPNPRAELKLSQEYYHTVCQFMKYKNVSPHALFLIYRSLFM